MSTYRCMLRHHILLLRDAGNAALHGHADGAWGAETVRESDIEKLSFAVELADAFFSESQVVLISRPSAPFAL